MDFFKVRERSSKKGLIEIYPDFVVTRSKDLMVRGKSFYAIWDEQKGMWSTDEYDVARLVDAELFKYADELRRDRAVDAVISVRDVTSYSTNGWVQFKNYISRIADCGIQLDEKLTFLNTEVKREDYVSKRLGYSLGEGDYSAWDKLVGTLYDEDERRKIEWSIGAIVSGDSRDIQKFLVFYGEAGAGKSTILNVIQKLFDGYYVTFDAKALASNNNEFSTDVFRTNPLVAIQHDGDLSHIEDNTKLNSIVSHEMMTMKEKYKSSYMSRANCFLYMATNRPVKITDSKSGIIRRLIDVKPTGKKIPARQYNSLMKQIDFQLGAIAQHCLDIYQKLGKNYYDKYIPFEMIAKTDVFFNFVEDSFDIFKEQDGIALKQAYAMYKTYCETTLVEWKMPMYKFREELKNYFEEFLDATRIDGSYVRSYYRGFKVSKFTGEQEDKEVEKPFCLVLDKEVSLLDDILADCPAQLANKYEVPKVDWSDCKTVLKDIDTHKLHYVKPPLNHIVIDFDLKDADGNKCADKNLEAASQWPVTYAEFSKGGNGIHLHYIYDGDPLELSRIYDDGIEIKVFNGGATLRRRLSKCNDIPIAHISSGLPLKGGKMVDFEAIKSAKSLRRFIENCLEKKHHGHTKPEVDYIYSELEKAYESGLKYDLTTMRPKVLAFAANSSNKPEYCIKLVNEMKFASEDISSALENYKDDRMVFFDIEVFPNLFLVNWKYAGDDKTCVRMINPSREDIGKLMEMKLVGFNCRRYDNHILYAWYDGRCKTLYDLYILSQRIIGNSENALIGEAYNVSYTDVYDFCSTKQSLKKWEIELGIHHQELGLPWDQPVPEEKWQLVAEYCDNDVIATEAVFNARKADWTARKILADISGLSVNDTTNQHTARIIFGDVKAPQSEFVYTDLSEMFPGYKFENGKSTYRGEVTGEGGYVYAEPGMYWNVALLDVNSMHPSSMENLNLFGPYTKIFSDLKNARVLIKHKQFDEAGKLFNGKLVPYFNDPEALDGLDYALKIAINSVYGLTSASFPNKFKDPRNIDNIVAKRGALFMVDLKHAVQEKGFTVAHIKTDSIKIPNATPEIIEFVKNFGKLYGYVFDHEATYDRMCLVNNAVYIARYDDQGVRNKGGKKANEWTATGTQFLQPYVFKKLFSKEPVEFRDMCETMTVTTALYLDFNEDLPNVKPQEEELSRREYNVAHPDKPKKLNREFAEMSNEELQLDISKGHKYHFVGRAGLFTPVKDGNGGGLLVRENNGKYNSAGGAKGYRWMESEVLSASGHEDWVDRRYYDALANAAVDDISKYGDFEVFQNAPVGAFRDAVAKEDKELDIPTGTVPCGDPKYVTCVDCPHFMDDHAPCDKL